MLVHDSRMADKVYLKCLGYFDALGFFCLGCFVFFPQTIKYMKCRELST